MGEKLIDREAPAKTEMTNEELARRLVGHAVTMDDEGWTGIAESLRLAASRLAAQDGRKMALKEVAEWAEELERQERLDGYPNSYANAISRVAAHCRALMEQADED